MKTISLKKENAGTRKSATRSLAAGLAAGFLGGLMGLIAGGPGYLFLTFALWDYIENMPQFERITVNTEDLMIFFYLVPMAIIFSCLCIVTGGVLGYRSGARQGIKTALGMLIGAAAGASMCAIATVWMVFA